MQKALIGKKIGMTQIFDANGNVVPVTVVEAGPCSVVMKKTVENDGYEAVQRLRRRQSSESQQAHEGSLRQGGHSPQEKSIREF